MKISCGAIFYSYDIYGNLGFILGEEYNTWLPFKGCKDYNETNEETAIREIYEETCGLVKITDINLDLVFNTKNKLYYIGLIEVPYNILNKFKNIRKVATDPCSIEKTRMRFFKLTNLPKMRFHKITKKCIDFYYNYLVELHNTKTNTKKLNKTTSACLELKNNTIKSKYLKS